MNQKSPVDILVDKGYEDVIVFRSPDYIGALIGLTDNYNAVYDYELMIDWLIKHENMDLEEAIDFISYNESFYCGEHYPVIYYGSYFKDEENFDQEIVFTRVEDLPYKNQLKIK